MGLVVSIVLQDIQSKRRLESRETAQQQGMLLMSLTLGQEERVVGSRWG